MKKIKSIKAANKILFKRYLQILNEYKKYDDDEGIVLSKAMCEHVINDDTMLEDKESRWLGFVQGILYIYDLIDVDQERDVSRPLFHEAYEAMGIDKPKSISL